MWYFILWLTLGILLVIHRHIYRLWSTGQIAFTGVWFASLTVLSLSPSTWDCISQDAAIFIIYAHVFFFFGSTLVPVYNQWRPPNEPIITPVVSNAIVRLFWAFILVGLIGSILSVIKSRAIEAHLDGTLVYVRHLVVTRELQIPVYQRMMSNILYPASLIGAITFSCIKPLKWSWLYLSLPIFVSILYSFVFGGRGAITITTPIMLWALVISRKHKSKAKVIKWKIYLPIICIASLVLWFDLVIAGTRPNSDGAAQSLYIYFTSPIPAFSEWFKTHSAPLIGFNFSNIAPIREIMNIFGYHSERSIGFDVVTLPGGYINIFTHLAEHVRDFGIIGALSISTILGMISSKLEMMPLSASNLGIRATIYGYLSFSLFADVSFLATGWWLTLLVSAILIPMFRSRRNNNIACRKLQQFNLTQNIH